MDSLQYLRFGSQDSLDEDRVYVVHVMPPFQDCKAFCDQKPENRNLITLEDGIVEECYKGTPDEINNALYNTYQLHNQEYENPISTTVTRIAPLKVVRATRIILSHFSKTKYRDIVKQALKSNNQDKRRAVLESLNFTNPDFSPDQSKSLAFQLGQTNALILGHEFYTKSNLSEFFPELHSLLYRKSGANAEPLNEHRDMLLEKIDKIYAKQSGDLNIFCYVRPPEVKDWNIFARQSRGMVIDMKKERCVHYPLDKFFKLGEMSETEVKNLPETEPEIYEKIDGSMISAFMHNGELVFASKGGLANIHIDKARQIAQNYDFSRLRFDKFYYAFELVFPENRFPHNMCLVDYGDIEALYLVGIRDRLTNETLPYSEVVKQAEENNFPYPKKYSGRLEQVISETQQNGRLEKEGYVARFPNQLYVKIKYPAFDKASKLVHDINKDRFVRRYIQMSEQEQQEVLDPLPDDFRQMAQTQLDRYYSIQRRVLDYIEQLRQEHHDMNERDFASYARENIHPQLMTLSQRYKRTGATDKRLLTKALKYFYYNGGFNV